MAPAVAPKKKPHPPRTRADVAKQQPQKRRGRKPTYHRHELLAALQQLPFQQRRSVNAIAAALNISRATVNRMRLWNKSYKYKVEGFTADTALQDNPAPDGPGVDPDVTEEAANEEQNDVRNKKAPKKTKKQGGSQQQQQQRDAMMMPQQPLQFPMAPGMMGMPNAAWMGGIPPASAMMGGIMPNMGSSAMMPLLGGGVPLGLGVGTAAILQQQQMMLTFLMQQQQRMMMMLELQQQQQGAIVAAQGQKKPNRRGTSTTDC